MYPNFLSLDTISVDISVYRYSASYQILFSGPLNDSYFPELPCKFRSYSNISEPIALPMLSISLISAQLIFWGDSGNPCATSGWFESFQWVLSCAHCYIFQGRCYPALQPPCSLHIHSLRNSSVSEFLVFLYVFYYINFNFRQVIIQL